MNLSTCQAYVEKTMKHRRSIPLELSFENVIQNKALPVRYAKNLLQSHFDAA